MIVMMKSLLYGRPDFLSTILSLLLIVNFQKIDFKNQSLLLTLILLIYFNFFSDLSYSIREGGSLKSIVYSRNASVIIFLLYGLTHKNFFNKVLSSGLLLVSQSKLFFLSLFSFKKKIILFSSIILFIISFNFNFSIIFERLIFFYEKRGAFYTIFSGRIERLLNNNPIDFSNFLSFNVVEPLTYEIEILDLYERFGFIFLVLFVYTLIITFNKYKYDRPSLIILVLIGLNFAGHIVENPLVIMYLLVFLKSHIHPEKNVNN